MILIEFCVLFLNLCFGILSWKCHSSCYLVCISAGQSQVNISRSNGDLFHQWELSLHGACRQSCCAVYHRDIIQPVLREPVVQGCCRVSQGTSGVCFCSWRSWVVWPARSPHPCHEPLTSSFSQVIFSAAENGTLGDARKDYPWQRGSALSAMVAVVSSASAFPVLQCFSVWHANH